mmetsp:Transcript_14328/g.29957  ORF Transcript_14328/g.29957 Transcript_14328/m.29957 type:complete len:211 (+) Transcript_14328:647-1279(+)
MAGFRLLRPVRGRFVGIHVSRDLDRTRCSAFFLRLYLCSKVLSRVAPWSLCLIRLIRLVCLIRQFSFMLLNLLNLFQPRRSLQHLLRQLFEHCLDILLSSGRSGFVVRCIVGLYVVRHLRRSICCRSSRGSGSGSSCGSCFQGQARFSFEAWPRTPSGWPACITCSTSRLPRNQSLIGAGRGNLHLQHVSHIQWAAPAGRGSTLEQLCGS